MLIWGNSDRGFKIDSRLRGNDVWLKESPKENNNVEHIYAPWRAKYIKNKKAADDSASAEHCTFCTKLAESDDEKNFIIQRAEHCTILLNLYPYNAGHLLIVPFAHKKNLHELSKESRKELMELTTQSVQIMQEQVGAEGVNIGLNLGKAAGAGIPSHLHMHVLPRWESDTNYLPVIGKTKSISLDLQDVYYDLRAYFLAN